MVLLALVISGCGSSNGSAGPAEPGSGTISEPAASPEVTSNPDIVDPDTVDPDTNEPGSGEAGLEGDLFACRPPEVVVASGQKLEDEYCKNYRDMWGAMTAIGTDAALKVQQYLRTQGMTAKKSGRYAIDWPTAKARFDDVAERWKGTPQILLIDAARAAAYLDRADNGEFAPAR